MLDIEKGTGYDIAARFKQSVGCFWSASHQQVYKELSTLSGLGWVVYQEVIRSGKETKVYSLTDEGREELSSWLLRPCKPRSYKDPFLVKVYASGNNDRVALLEELETQIGIHDQTLAAYRALDSWLGARINAGHEKFRFPHATLKFGLRTEQAWLEWAAELKNELLSQG
ncbi:MAG: hypothetical protein CSA52_02165 [Gammaproteobacteria bacterium]|nr:MAG: hypothetical protein CSB48_06150 [Pseudomonadota bacterium]PIE38398.1 MAG: hypothetical protein CSA52_02165 [Gammaproteobacteria bacterium]